MVRKVPLPELKVSTSSAALKMGSASSDGGGQGQVLTPDANARFPSLPIHDEKILDEQDLADHLRPYHAKLERLSGVTPTVRTFPPNAARAIVPTAAKPHCNRC